MDTTTANLTVLTPSPVAAIVLLALSAPALFLHLMTLTIFATHAEYRRLSCFRIMFSIGVQYVIELAATLLYATQMVLAWNWCYPSIISAGVLQPLQAGTFPHHLVLAVNRLVVVSRMRATPGSSYTSTSGRERRLVGSALLVCWLFAIALFVYRFLPTALVEWDGMLLVRVYAYAILDAPALNSALVFAVYLAVVAVLIRRVRIFRPSHESHVLRYHVFSGVGAKANKVTHLP